MSTEDALAEWLLESAAQHQQPPKDLGSVAGRFLGTVYTGPDGPVLPQELEQLHSGKRIKHIRQRRQKNALLVIARSFPPPWGFTTYASYGPPLPQSAHEIAAKQKAREDAERSLAKDLKAAEEAFRARAPEIAEQLPEVAKAAEKTPADSPVAQAAARIKGIVSQAELSKLGPYWALIVLYWLIAHVSVDSMAALTLWYMVVSDYVKKKD